MLLHVAVAFLCCRMLMMDMEVHCSDLSWRKNFVIVFFSGVCGQPSFASFIRVCITCRRPLHPEVCHFWAGQHSEPDHGRLWRPGLFGCHGIILTGYMCYILAGLQSVSLYCTSTSPSDSSPSLSQGFVPNEYPAHQTHFHHLLPENPTCHGRCWEWSNSAGDMMGPGRCVTCHLAGSQDFITGGWWNTDNLWHKVAGTSDE